MYETLYAEKPEELPSVNFVRRCRVVVEIIGETIAAIKLASADNWKQLWTDATTRRQIPFTALVIGLLGDEDNIDPVVVSSCIFMEDEKSDTQADGILAKIDSLKHRLERLSSMVEEKCPEKIGLVPSPDEINIDKLGDGGVVMTDTCNAAQKLRRILVSIADGVFDLDCMNHLRNVWFGGVEKALTKHLNELLRTSLDDIDTMLRVTASISAIIRAIDKEFSLSANYPKGHGELFKAWMKKNYPGALLFHVERAAGSRQDLCTEGSLAIFMNYPYYAEFLDEQLSKVSTNLQASILQRNLWVVLTSSEMIALARLLSILHISICMPFRYLAGKTHEFTQYNWGAADMSRVIDTLHETLKRIKADPDLILDPLFMMNIFKDYRNELPPFKEYWELTFKKKQMQVIARQDGTKIVHYARLLKYLFHPTRSMDKDTNARVIELAYVAINAFIQELLDPKKATWKYLSDSGSDYCWSKMTNERKEALVGVTATNDEAESVLGGTTANVQRFGRINLS